MTCLNRKLFHDQFVLLYISKKMNLDFSSISCELNRDANLNGCELNGEIAVDPLDKITIFCASLPRKLQIQMQLT